MRSTEEWRRALQFLPVVRTGRWAVCGSAALALHGLSINPRDLDIIADDVAASELIDGLRSYIERDDAPWDRGDVRATRRALAVVEGVDLEILVGVEAVAMGVVVFGSPDLSCVDHIDIDGRLIPVLPLSTMLALFEATGGRERAAMVRAAI